MAIESPYPLTRAVKALLVANGAVFLLQLLPGIGDTVEHFGTLYPAETFLGGQLWRCVSYMFLHSTHDILHLLFNMLALWMFGGELEEKWGTRTFVVHYFLFGIGSGLFSALYLLHPLMRLTAIMGASGAVMGLLTAYAVYYPDRRILLFFVIPVRAWMLVAGFAVISLVLGFTQGSGIAHFVHLGGIVVAFAYLRGVPYANGWLDLQKSMAAERTQRRRAEQRAARTRLFNEQIDPILDKISKNGMESLTQAERRLLEQAAKNREETRQGKIVSLEAWKKQKGKK